MWVYDKATLRFLDVNEAAVRNYGYTRDEFAAMTIREIRVQGRPKPMFDRYGIQQPPCRLFRKPDAGATAGKAARLSS